MAHHGEQRDACDADHLNIAGVNRTVTGRMSSRSPVERRTTSRRRLADGADARRRSVIAWPRCGCSRGAVAANREAYDRVISAHPPPGQNELPNDILDVERVRKSSPPRLDVCDMAPFPPVSPPPAVAGGVSSFRGAVLAGGVGVACFTAGTVLGVGLGTGRVATALDGCFTFSGFGSGGVSAGFSCTTPTARSPGGAANSSTR
jgi:hypothetical protein